MKFLSAYDSALKICSGEVSSYLAAQHDQHLVLIKELSGFCAETERLLWALIAKFDSMRKELDVIAVGSTISGFSSRLADLDRDYLDEHIRPFLGPIARLLPVAIHPYLPFTVPWSLSKHHIVSHLIVLEFYVYVKDVKTAFVKYWGLRCQSPSGLDTSWRDVRTACSGAETQRS